MIEQPASCVRNESKILVLLPAYNESAHIAAVIAEASTHLPVLVVDDGSKDGTADIAQKNGALVIRQVNQGKGKALRVGFQYALEHGFDAVITLDADGQHDASEIPLFIQKHSAEGSDLVIGQRQFDQMPLVRRLSNTIAPGSSPGQSVNASVTTSLVTA